MRRCIIIIKENTHIYQVNNNKSDMCVIIHAYFEYRLEVEEVTQLFLHNIQLLLRLTMMKEMVHVIV